MAQTQRTPLDSLVRFVTSLGLTIACLSLGFVLILIGTIAQVKLGIDRAVDEYFRSWLVFVPLGESGIRIPYFPGGYLIGFVLLINLVAAHVYRFKWSWQKLGIWMVHVGLIVLLLGEFLTAVFSVESFVRLTEGETKNYSEAYRETELAIIDRTDPATDKVVAIAQGALEPGRSLQHGALPFRVDVKRFYANSRVTERPPPPGELAATQGFGARVQTVELPRTGRTDQRDLPAAWFELVGPGGSLGTWMTSLWFERPQTFTHEGRTYALEMRPRRYYKPYALTLHDFTHERYPGTEIPKDFSSRVQLVHPAAGENREALIYMNHPLRYDGLTFYQSGYEGERTTVLQVVANPSRHFPYISCVLVTLGLLTQFGIHLVRFFGRRSALKTAAVPVPAS